MGKDKKCPKCKIIKPVDEFVDISGYFNKRGRYCKSCYEKNERKWEKSANKETQARMQRLKTMYGKYWEHNALPNDFIYFLSKERDFCPYCGEELKQSHIEHMDPLGLGGEDSIRNTLYSCESCNLRKGAMSFVDWRKQLSPKYRGISTEIYLKKHGHLPEKFQPEEPTYRNEGSIFDLLDNDLLSEEEILDLFPPLKVDTSLSNKQM